MCAKTAYSRLVMRFSRIGHLRAIESLLFWDGQTVMPAGGAASRADQMGSLAALIHELLSAPDVQRDLETAIADSDRLEAWQQANLREMRWTWAHAHAIDDQLASDIARTSAETIECWAAAKAADDFKSFAPALQAMVDLQRRKADAKAVALGCSPYDALLDEYDPGARAAEIDRVFAVLEAFLPTFIRDCGSRAPNDASDRREPIPRERQVLLVRELLARVGYRLDDARLDEARHPFSLAFVPGDSRIAIRYDEANVMSAVTATLHEVGHAFYEANLPSAFHYQPVGYARGASMHESQSLAMDMQAGRSDGFLGFLFPLLRKTLGVSGAGWQDERLLADWRRVEPTTIRVDADEATYPLHIILRYRIERGLIDGQLRVADLPEIWRAEMQRLLGIRPATEAQGCLQDIQWAAGMFGYFPSYTLGAIKAAQFFAAARQEVADLPTHLANGDFEPWKLWLADKVHRWGSFHTDSELLRQATGSDLDVGIFQRHLEQRYGRRQA